MKYDPATIEPRWQKTWEDTRAFSTPSDLEVLKQKPKYYVLDMFPYPSGSGLHVGHPEGYTATDVMARFKRMKGFHVLHPMGWDAFGLPAERAAVRENLHPEKITRRNVDNFRRQIKRLGFSYDWEREVSTADPDYYKWTQWIFLKLYEKGLAYTAEVPVNWCPALGTVLANEEVKDGRYVETGDPVERRSMKQWMLKITAYAERLLTDLDDVDWPESVKEMQRNWIGKSHGAEVRFRIQNPDHSSSEDAFAVFTTRPDTLFGATYCVLAPEHPLVTKITTAMNQDRVDAYIHASVNRSDLDRTELTKEKTGVFTGGFAINPVNQKPIPIWVADYVLMSYGSGAIMAVPGHDERDHAFAKNFGIDIIEVVSGGEISVDEEAYSGDGLLVNSEFLNGLSVEDAKERINAWLEAEGHGKGRVQYRLRDWLFSRQRYWGEPFPMVHAEDGEVIPVPEEDLPVLLPSVDEYKPTPDGKPPLARAEDWLHVQLPDGRKATRETNTMPQWAGSCWYYLRYLDPKNTNAPWSKEQEKYWLPVDLYVGGVEHAVLHLLYARFWHKVLYDCGLVSTTEPFQKLFNQGMILAYSYKDANGKYHLPEHVEKKSDQWFVKESGLPVQTQIEKMSKSRFNVVSPDDVIDQYGSDAMRLYELFMGPLEQVKPWQMNGVEGVSRFLHRVWRLIVNPENDALSEKISNDPAESTPGLQKALHRTIRKVTHDTEGMRFNTAIATMMSFVNEASSSLTLPNEIAQTFLRIIAPYAPHIAEELNHRLGVNELIAHAEWPAFIEHLCIDESITLGVQINGKRRDEIVVPVDADRKTCEEAALASIKIQKHLEGRAPKKVIVVPGRLVNIVA